MNGCQAFGSKDVNIINNQIFDLAFVYCEDAPSPTIVASIADPSNSFDGYNLESLVVNLDGIAQPADISVNTFDPSTFTFNPNNATPVLNDTSDFVSLNFVGLYRLRDNPNDSIPVTQRVNVYRFPDVSLTSEQDPSNTGIVETCIDFGNIIFRGDPVSDGISTIGIYTLYDASNTLITGQITVNANQSITINTDNLGNTVGVGTYRIDYAYANSVSTCVATSSMQLIINPKPVAAFSILGKTTLDGCVGEPIEFQNESDILTGSTFDWKFNDDSADDESQLENPIHEFVDARSYNVTLTTKTDKGCISDIVTNAIAIGDNPATAFTFSQVAVGTPTIFY